MEEALEFKYLIRALFGLLLIVSACMMAVFAIGILLGETTCAVKSFLIPCILGILMLIVLLATKKQNEKAVLSQRMGYLFVTLAWVFSALLGSLPFVFSGAIPSFIDAFFETMSGFTTTGATILTDIEVLPKCILLWRAVTHWLGGMGIVVLTVAILPLLGIGGRTLIEAEAPGPQVDKFTPRISETAKILWLIYLGLTVIEILLLALGGMSLIDAVTHAFATMATGGFSTKNLSVGAYNSAYIDIVITIFMLFAGLNFSLYWKVLKGDLRSFFKDTEAKVYLLIFVTASILIAVNLLREGQYTNFETAWRYASFQAASILTTTGFVTADYLAWPALAQTVLFILMFIGGCSGSTGGGIKVGRIVTLVKMGFTEMRYLIQPRGIHGIFLDGKYLKKNVVYDIAAMVFLYLMSMIVSTFVVSTGGYDIMTSLTATLATLGNIGPGFALVGPVFNYAFFPDYIKVWLSFIMLLGRLEIYTVLVIFTKSYWK